MFFKHAKVSASQGYFFKPAVFFLLFCFFQSAHSVEGVEFNQAQWNEIEKSSLIAPHNLENIKTKLQGDSGVANIVLMINSDLDQNGLAEKDLSVAQNINALKSYVVGVINDYWYFHDNNSDIDMLHKFKLLPELELMVNFDGLYELVKNQETKWIEYNHEGSFDTLQALEDISGIIPRATFDGSGVSIVILDSGVDLTHQDLGGDGVSECGDIVYANSKIIGGANTVLPGQNDDQSLANDTDNPCPYEPETGLRGTIDHGTAMASFAAGEEPTSGNVDGYVGGVAPGATVYGVLVNRIATASSGISGVVPTSAAVERGMEFAIENLSASPDNPIKVVSTSLSFGDLSNIDVACDERSLSLRGRIEMLRDQGVMHVSSSGNGTGIVNAGAGDDDQISFPACLTATVSVSSTDNNLQRSFFANTSEALDLYAPGTATGATLNHTYRIVSGTSISTPIVAGAVAVLQNAAKVHLNRYLTVDEALGYLTDNGSDVTVERDGLSTLVRPLINIQASVDALIVDAGGEPLDEPLETASVIFPALGSTLSGNLVTFEWEDIGASRYTISVGTTPRGSDIFNRRGVGGNTSWRVGNIPIDGSTVYVTIEATTVDGISISDNQFIARDVNTDELISDVVLPVPGSTLSSNQITFE